MDAETKLVLTNAIYFKAAWAEIFSKEQTIDEDFFAARATALVESNFFARPRVRLRPLRLFAEPMPERSVPPDRLRLSRMDRRALASELRSEADLCCPKEEKRLTRV